MTLLREMFAGDVDAVGDESIQTKFLGLGLPLLPVQSYYIRGPSTGCNPCGFSVGLHLRSIMSGYLRYWLGLPIAAVLLSLNVIGSQPTVCGYSCAATGLWLAVLWWVARPPARVARQRKILGMVVGLGADPCWVPRDMVPQILENLNKKWELVRGEFSLQKIDDALGERALLPLVYAIARYENRLHPNVESATLAQKAWKNIEEGWCTWGKICNESEKVRCNKGVN